MSSFNNAEFVFAAGESSQLPIAKLPEIVFSGKSNVGKSSLINKLVNRKNLARVSATPGKTGTVNFYEVKDFYLVDLPGYGYAKVSYSEKKRWGELVEGYLNQDRDIRLIIQILDIRHKPTADDMQMINYLCERELPFIIILTKKDKLNKTALEKRLKEIRNELPQCDNIEIYPFSALNGDGVNDIKEAIDRYLL